MDAPCRATRAGTQAPPLPIPIIFFHAIPYKQNNHLRAIHSNETNRPTRNSSQTKSTVPHVICPNETVGANIRAQFSQAKCVGAVPVCPPERPRSGVSIREIGFVYHALCAGNLTMDAPLQGDAGGHIGTAPTTLRNIFPRNPT